MQRLSIEMQRPEPTYLPVKASLSERVAKYPLSIIADSALSHCHDLVEICIKMCCKFPQAGSSLRALYYACPTIYLVDAHDNGIIIATSGSEA